MTDATKTYFRQADTVLRWWFPEDPTHPLYPHFAEQLRWVLALQDWRGSFVEDGYYDIWSDVDAYIKIAPTANDVTTGSGYPVFANTIVPNVMVLVGDKLGAIAGGDGTLRYHKVS